MKFKQTLIVDSKEIALLTEAMRLYRAHVDKCYDAGSFGAFGKERYVRYRAKVISVTNVLEAMNVSEKPVISEASIFSKEP